MKKVCFIVGLYGEEVNGGAEKHCKMLAEKATALYDVEVLTSTVNNYKTFDRFYEEGAQVINNVKVRRFNPLPFQPDSFLNAHKKSRIGRKVRRLLYRIGILKYMSSWLPTISLNKEVNALQLNGLFSNTLIDYITSHEQDYQAIFLVSYPCPNFYFISKKIGHKCILIPTAHDEGDFFRSYLSEVFSKVKHIAFNTKKEQELCYNIFGNKMAPSSILAVGVELAEGKHYNHIRDKFSLPDRYILYFGRIAEEKIGDLLQWFLEFKAENDDPVKLVLTGGIFMEMYNHPDIIYTGFVDEAEKTALIEHAELVVNPSDRESLSLLLLETMQLGKPSLVNGKSDVLKQHCIDSHYAANYYLSKSDFKYKLGEALRPKSTTERENESKKAIQYVEQNYSWSIIVQRLKNLVEESFIAY